MIRASKERARRTSSSRLARDKVREDGLENVGVRYIMCAYIFAWGRVRGVLNSCFPKTRNLVSLLGHF